MTGRINQTSGKCGCEQIAKSIALLKHTRDYTTSCFWAIFKRSCSRITVQTTHCNSKERSTCKERLIGGTETGAEFQNNEKEVVDYKRPLVAKFSAWIIHLPNQVLTFRPQRSAASPKMIEPTDRNISTSVIPQVLLYDRSVVEDSCI